MAKVPSAGVVSRWRNAPIAEQPRAVILDPTCRAPLTKILHKVTKRQAHSPWIFCRDDVASRGDGYVPMKASDNGKFIWGNMYSVDIMGQRRQHAYD